jgi:hypothetical protein
VGVADDERSERDTKHSNNGRDPPELRGARASASVLAPRFRPLPRPPALWLQLDRPVLLDSLGLDAGQPALHGGERGSLTLDHEFSSRTGPATMRP